MSPTLISEITADFDAGTGDCWHPAEADPVWPIVYLDGIVVHVRGANSRVSAQTMYVALGGNMQGRKDTFGTLAPVRLKGPSFAISCRTDLKHRGPKDIFIACMDVLSGFPDAAPPAATWTPRMHTVHLALVRAALKYVVDKDSDQVIVDLKKIYQAPTVAEAGRGPGRFRSSLE